jgi:hypothetical protein
MFAHLIRVIRRPPKTAANVKTTNASRIGTTGSAWKPDTSLNENGIA